MTDASVVFVVVVVAAAGGDDAVVVGDGSADANEVLVTCNSL